MGIFSINPNEAAYVGGKKHFVDVIKNQSPNDTLIFRNPEEDFNNGSTLIVEPGEQAIFVDGGNIQQVFRSGTYTLNTENYPFISRLRNAFSGGISSFHCLVYFVRTATSREIKWGTQTPIKVYDKALGDQFTGIGVETEVCARGAYRVKVGNAAVLLTQLIGGNYELSDQSSIGQFFQNQFLGNIVSQLAESLNAWQGPLIQVPSQMTTYAAKLQQTLTPILDEYGLVLLQFNMSGIDIVDNEERRQAMELVSQNRERYYGNMAAGAGMAAYAQGQQQAYQTYGTNYQQAQVLNAMNEAASNPSGDGGTFVGAGMGLSMGAGLGQVFSGLAGAAMNSQSNNNMASDGSSTQSSEHTVADPVDRMKKLVGLHDAGLISDEEFANKRQEILAGI